MYKEFENEKSYLNDKQGIYNQYPVLLLDDENICHTDIIVYSIIQGLCHKTGECNATNGYLAERCKSSVRTVQRSLASLIKNGYIHVNIDKIETGTWRTIVIRARHLSHTGYDQDGTRGMTKTAHQKTKTRKSNTREIDSSLVNEAPDFLEIEAPKEKEKKEVKPKPTQKAQKEPSTHSEFVHIYFEWYKAKVGISPKLAAKEFKALKSIREYFEKIQREKGKGDEAPLWAVRSWQYLLDNWCLLDKFYQANVGITQIESSLATIIAQIQTNKSKPTKPMLSSQGIGSVGSTFTM